MKTILISILSILLMSYGIEQENNDIVINSDISSVKVFLNSAEIQRNTNIKLSKGKTDIVFKGISSKIKEKSLKIKFFSKNVKVYSIKIEKNKNVFKESQKWQSIHRQLTEKDKEIEQIEININTLKSSLKFYNANMKIGGNNPVSFATINRNETLFSKKIKSIYTKINLQEEKIDSINEVKKRINDELEKLENQLVKTNRVVRIKVLSNENLSTQINLRYLVDNAIWKPLYTIRANSDNNILNFMYQAQIYNDTGNDWKNKKLTLALVDLSEDVSRPKLKTWVLSDSDSDYRYSEGRLNNFKGKFNENVNNEQYDVIAVNDLNTEFIINDIHTIPSDATPHTIDVKSFEKDAEYYNLSIPKIKKGVFVIAKIRNWQKMGLIDGKCNLYYNDEYQGQIMLDTKQIGNSLELSVGKNSVCKVNKRKLSNKSSKNFIGTYINEEIVYEFILQNTGNKEVEIELRDQLPVSNFKNIVVTPLQLSNANVDQQNGMLTWHISLKPNKRKKIIFSFKVKYPKNMRNLLKINRMKIASPRFF